MNGIMGCDSTITGFQCCEFGRGLYGEPVRATVSNQDNTRQKVGRWLHLKVWRRRTSAAVIGE